MKKQLFISFLLLSVISEVSAVIFVKIDSFNEIEIHKSRKLWKYEKYTDKDGKEIYIDSKGRVTHNRYQPSVINNQLYFCGNKNVQNWIKESNGFVVKYAKYQKHCADKQEKIKPNMNSPHYKNCYICSLDEKNDRRLAALNAKENIFYEQTLKDLVDHQDIVVNSYKKAETSMNDELDIIKNNIDKEWSQWSFFERLVNYFTIVKKHKILDENCRKKHGILEYKVNLEAIEQEIQSFTNPINRESLTRSWVDKKDFESLRDMRNDYEERKLKRIL